MADSHATGSRAAYLIRHPLPGQKRVWKVIDRATDEIISTHTVYEDAVEASLDAQRGMTDRVATGYGRHPTRYKASEDPTPEDYPTDPRKAANGDWLITAMLHVPFVLADGSVCYLVLPPDGLSEQDCVRLAAMVVEWSVPNEDDDA